MKKGIAAIAFALANLLPAGKALSPISGPTANRGTLFVRADGRHTAWAIGELFRMCCGCFSRPFRYRSSTTFSGAFHPAFFPIPGLMK
jgi:hypothetical protein